MPHASFHPRCKGEGFDQSLDLDYQKYSDVLVQHFKSLMVCVSVEVLTPVGNSKNLKGVRAS